MPTNMTAMPGSEAFISDVDKAPAYWMQDILWIILADAKQTGGRGSMMEQLLPRGSGPPPHKHAWSDEIFYILDGDLTFLIGDDIRTAGKGDFVMVPRDTRHGFRVDSDTARFLNGYTPASMEALVAEIGKPALERVLPPKGPAPSGMMTPEQLTPHGLQWLPGPDPLRPNGH
jgi:quercetin dioxygenase-like cupin family protein